jgi:hypothetical protein
LINIPFKYPKPLFRISLFLSVGHLKSATSCLAFSDNLGKLQNLIAGTFEDQYDTYSEPSAMLFIPILVDNNVKIRKALEESNAIIEKTFGKKATPNFSFEGLKRLVVFSTLLAILIIFHFMLGFQFFPCLIIWVIITICFASLIGNVRILLDSAVYNYCTGLPTGQLSKEKIISLFTK